MCVMVPRGKTEVSSLSKFAMGPASSFPSGTQTSRTLPGRLGLIGNAIDASIHIRMAAVWPAMNQGSPCLALSLSLYIYICI